MVEAAPLPIMLLPGLDGTGRLLPRLQAELSRTRPATIIAYPTDLPLGYDELVGLVEARMPAGRFVVLGESFSGPVAMELAARYADRVAGLVMAVTFARRPTAFGGLARAWTALRLPRPLWLAAWGLMGRDTTPELKGVLGQALGEVSNAVIARRVDAATRVDKLARLREVRCPMLYIAGKRDWLMGRRPRREIVAAAPSCAVYEIDGPHLLLATQAGEAAKAIERFCSTLP